MDVSVTTVNEVGLALTMGRQSFRLQQLQHFFKKIKEMK